MITDHDMDLGYVARQDGEEAVMVRPDGSEAGRWRSAEISVGEFQRRILDDFSGRLGVRAETAVAPR